MTQECLKTVNAVIAFAKIMGDKNKIAANPIYVHKDVDDNDVYKLVAKAFTTNVDTNAKDNSIALMNEGCILMKLKDKFYLFNAKISSSAMILDGDNTATLHCWCDYSDGMKIEDFTMLGGNA